MAARIQVCACARIFVYKTQGRNPGLNIQAHSEWSTTLPARRDESVDTVPPLITHFHELFVFLIGSKSEDFSSVECASR